MTTTRAVSLTHDLETAYFNYAVEVITDRALPRVEDGLLPVQRRILYAMHEMGLSHARAHKKSARVVGEVLGKFHPHGDASVYGSLARLAQDFSLRLPLIDGQGNFGSIDGDPPAAMRYTEARLSAAAELLLQDIDQEAVDLVENFDSSLLEPVILPAVLPNLLVNGAAGIAVGMSTNIPPHNLGEVCNALSHLAGHWSKRARLTVDDWLKFIPGPDFPTGGVVYRYRLDPGGGSGDDLVDTIRDAYLVGRGRVVTQARLDVEEIGGGKANIVVTELPYAVQKATVIDKIAREVGSGRIQGVSDLRDESDYTGMRLVIEVMRGYEPRLVMEQLLTYSQLRETFGVISRALVVDEEGEVKPVMLSLHQMLEQFIQHRLTVIIRRSRYELARREARLHIIEGLLKALDMVDAVVAAIRKSSSREAARQNLQKKPFDFSEEQAKAIVALPLGNLASLEIRTLKEEGRDVWNRIKVLKGLLADEGQRLQVVIDETAALKKAFATPRRTVILDRAEQAAGVAVTVAADLVKPAVTQTVAITTQGVLRGDSASFAYRVKEGPSGRAVEAHLAQFQLEPDDSLLLVSSAGRAWRARVGQVAAKADFAELGLGKGEVIVGGGVLRPAQDGLVVIGTRQGKIKRVRVAELGLSEASWAGLMGLDKGDEVLFAGVAGDAATVLFFTSGGKAVHFPANLVNPQSTPSAKGVGGIKVGKEDRVIAGSVVEPDEAAQVLIVSQTGYIKRAPLAEFPLKGRDTQGVQSLDLTKVTGPVAAATVTRPGAKFADVVSAKGWRWRLTLASVPVADRRKRGERLAKFEDDRIVRVAALPE